MLEQGTEEINRQDTKLRWWREKEGGKRAAGFFGRNFLDFYQYLELRTVILTAT